MAVSEQDLADVLAGMTRVHVAIVKGLAQNHPHSAANIVQELRLEADQAKRDGMPSLASLPARYLLELLEAKRSFAAPPPAPTRRRRFGSSER